MVQTQILMLQPDAFCEHKMQQHALGELIVPPNLLTGLRGQLCGWQEEGRSEEEGRAVEAERRGGKGKGKGQG